MLLFILMFHVCVTSLACLPTFHRASILSFSSDDTLSRYRESSFGIYCLYAFPRVIFFFFISRATCTRRGRAFIQPADAYVLQFHTSALNLLISKRRTRSVDFIPRKEDDTPANKETGINVVIRLLWCYHCILLLVELQLLLSGNCV